MSGLFSLLLARAQGDAGPSRVRPQAAPRWAGEDDGAVFADEIAPRPLAPPTDTRPAAAHEPVLPLRATTAPAVMPGAQPQHPSVRGEPAHAVQLERVPRSAARLAERELHAAAPTAAQHSAPPPAAAAAHLAQRPHTALQLLPEAPSSTGAAPPARLQAETAARSEAEPPTAHSAAPAASAPSAHAVPRPDAARVPRLATATLREDTTVVHVSIGRVELIAAASPPAARAPRSTPRGGSVPLAEYLRGKAR